MNYLALDKVIMGKLKTQTTHCEETLQGAVHGAGERRFSDQRQMNWFPGLLFCVNMLWEISELEVINRIVINIPHKPLLESDGI